MDGIGDKQYILFRATRRHTLKGGRVLEAVNVVVGIARNLPSVSASVDVGALGLNEGTRSSS